MPRTDYQPLWILGTDTNVGKTLVSAWLTAGLEATYWKPIQSGTVEGSDTETVRLLGRIPEQRLLAEVYRYKAPLSPHLAARLEAEYIHTDQIVLPEPSRVSTSYLLMEGAGGLMVPLNDDMLLVDLVRSIPAPVLLVCRSSLGTINHTLLSLQALSARRIPVLGYIMSGVPNPENEAAITHFSRLPCIARLPMLTEINHEELMNHWNTDIALRIMQRIQAL